MGGDETLSKDIFQILHHKCPSRAELYCYGGGERGARSKRVAVLFAAFGAKETISDLTLRAPTLLMPSMATPILVVVWLRLFVPLAWALFLREPTSSNRFKSPVLSKAATFGQSPEEQQTVYYYLEKIRDFEAKQHPEEASRKQQAEAVSTAYNNFSLILMNLCLINLPP